MNERHQLEDFRRRQYAQPHSAKSNLAAFAESQLESNIGPDCDRAIIHFDVDCFYAQV
jgi:hypothetical protein